MSDKSAISILVVEDENIVALDIQARLKRLGYKIAGHAETGEAAVSLAEEVRPGLILMDIRLKGDMDGVMAAEKIRQFMDVPVIFLSAFTDPETLERAKRTGPFGYILKPFEERDVASTIEMSMYRHGLEKDVRENRKWLNAVLNSIMDAVIATDAEGIISFMNPRAEEMLWKRHEDCIGKGIGDILDVNKYGTGEVIQHDTVEPFAPIDCVVKSIDRNDLDVSFSASPIFAVDGSVAGTVVILRDITERKRHEKQLEKTVEVVEAASNAKTEFLANISHEIRTPMNGILGMVELMQDTDVSGEQVEYLSIIKESSNALLGLLNDVLDMSRMASGKAELEIVEFELLPVLESVIDTAHALSKNIDVELILIIHRDVPPLLKGDPMKLRQVLSNLVGNASKFTLNGHVLLEVSLESAGEDKVGVKFAVQDTGIGIPKDRIDYIFDSFVQADGSTTRKYGGTGLGLAISKKIVTLMGGGIEVVSTPEVGSTFSFTVSFGFTKRMDSPVVAVVKGKRVLVLNGEGMFYDGILEALSPLQMEVINGGGNFEEVSSLLNSSGSGFDLVIVNFTSSPEQCYEKLEYVGNSAAARSARIVLFYRQNMKLSAKKCETLNVARCIKMPFKPSVVYGVIDELFGPDKAQGNQGDAEVSRYRVLLAEDNFINQQVILHCLESAGHDVTVVGNGQKAVEAVSGSEVFDVILMDLSMPVMNGFDAAKEIKATQGASGKYETPIVALTAHTGADVMQQCIDCGMSGLVSKPFEAQALYNAIKDAISAAVDESVCKRLDVNGASEMLDGDKEFLAELWQDFIRLVPEQIERMERALADGLKVELRREAHSLKSSSANVGALCLMKAAKSLEEAASSSSSTDAGLEKLLQQVKREFDGTVEAINKLVRK